MIAKILTLKTQDPREAEASIMSTGATSFIVDNKAGDFSFKSSFVQMKTLALAHVNCSTSGIMEFPSTSYVRQYFPIAGTGALKAGVLNCEVSPQKSGATVAPGDSVKFAGSAHIENLILRIEVEALERKLGALLDQDVRGRLVVDSQEGDRSSLMPHLRSAVFQLASDVGHFNSMLSEIGLAEIEQTILVKYLLFAKHNFSAHFVKKPREGGRNSLRMVEEYIEANWDKPLDIEKLSQVTGISARSIYRHFHRVRQCSPADFAKKIRLERARQVLRNPDDRTSVIGTALNCGFNSFGHFARDYRQLFGELPSDTLRRSASMSPSNA